jgi:UDP-N-acetylmuramyl pentapeptide phosphotransferase/UDP-N-acetylglucosamine-1-phosphate transferase
LLQQWVSRGDALPLDLLMGHAVTGITLTILVAGLYCHSVNLVDGMNGLAASIVVSAAAGLAVVALNVDQHQIAVLAALVGASTLGFIVLNWPVSRMFLGDAGAYGLGHLVVWLAISLIALNEAVAVPAVLLILFYPNADLFHTVLRRLVEGKAITEPDRMHLHQKVRRGVEVLWLGRDKRHISNPLSTLILMPFIAGPVVAGAIFWNRPVEAWLSLAAFFAAFAASHVLIMGLARRFRRSLDPVDFEDAAKAGTF